MAIIRNMTGQTLRFVDANDAVVKTISPDAVTVQLVDADTTTTLQGVLLRTLKPAAFVGLPAAVAGTFLLVAPGIALALYERGRGRTDVYEPEGPIQVNEELCYRGARHYVD
jgi:hypothetical protein